MRESDLQNAIIDYAKLMGWRVHAERAAWTGKGCRTPIQGHRGFFDLVLVRDRRIVFVELKSEKGKLSPEQELWREAVRDTGAEYYCWQPKHWMDSEVVEHTLL